MTPLVWLVAVIGAYAALAAAAAVSAAGMRRGRVVFFFVGVAMGLAVACARILPVGAAWALAGADAVALALFGLIYAALVRPGIRWKEARAGREAGRKTLLHLVLMTGAVIFMVPFAWLVVTSLKEDEDMSQFPPVWIPRQQVKVRIDGKEAGLATTLYHGLPLRVAVLEEQENGNNRVQVLGPALKGDGYSPTPVQQAEALDMARRRVQFEVPRSQVKKVKHFAPVWKNYPDALKFLPPETHRGLVFLYNTLFLSSLTVIGTVLSSSLVAFSFARLRWPGRDALFVVLLATMMLPGAVTMMPVFLIFRWLGWIDTLRPLWVPSFLGSAFNIFLLRQFFMTIPNDLEDAAKIDGCSYFGIYRRIMLPLIKPALAAITIMTFMGSWNNFMGPLIYVSSPTRMPLSYALQLFQTAHGGEPGLLMAASTMMVLPIVVLFFFTQRYFIQGVTLTGIKG
ncbi:MAG: carbohydrate ABC transporter permease [Chthonomonadales bacterium]